MSYSLFQTIMYIFGGTVLVLACITFLVPAQLTDKMNKYQLMSIPMMAFAIVAILHFATLLGLASNIFTFLGDFQTDEYGAIESGSIFGWIITLNAEEVQAFNRNGMNFAFIAVAPLLAFARLTRKPSSAA